MDIEFDPAKDAINIAKHGVPLAFGVKAFDDAKHLILPSIRTIDGEDRFKCVGFVGDRLWTAVHVHRSRSTRFLSVRRSNDGEQRLYHRARSGS